MPAIKLPESPITGSSYVGAAVTGRAFGAGNAGVSGTNASPPPPREGVAVPDMPEGDGVYGSGLNGVHGVSGDASGAAPKLGCGVLGQSDGGYGIYGASKTASGVYGTSGPGHFAGEFVGDVSVTGNVSATDVILSGADCAEEFDVLRGADIEPGSVVVFGDDGALETTDKPYDGRVAGVISGAGEFRPGVLLDRRISGRGRVPLALIGKVYCKVDATYAPINVGDLLTTSQTVGHAMKVVDSGKAFGTVIGKALARRNCGRGLIPILVTLQ